MIKKALTTIMVLVVISTATAAPQSRGVEIKNVTVEKSGDNLNVRFQAAVPAKSVKKDYKLTVTPVIYNVNGQQSLKPIVVDSRRVRIVDHRNGITPTKDAFYAQQGKTVEYVMELPYQQWMEGSSLRIDRALAGCCSEQHEQPELLASNMVFAEPKPFAPVYNKEPLPVAYMPVTEELKRVDVESSYVYAMSEYKVAKSDFDALRENGALLVTFNVGSATIDQSNPENATSLTQVKKVLGLIKADPNAEVGKIVIAGTASPEGKADINDKLAARRAEALKEYLGNTIDPKVFEIVNVGEDWTMLRRIVENSTMPNKQAVLDIIEKYGVYNGRELELMKLNGGRDYNYMLREFFPKLRSAGYIQIFYERKPDIDFAPTNEAIEKINNQDYTGALELLGRLRPIAQTYNLMGVCHMMTGDKEQAESDFKKAIAAGSSDAAKNLEQLSR